MIKNENGLVNVNDLKEHPLNEKLYPADKHDHQIALLGEKMDEEYKQSGVPNHTPVDYCPETGTLNSGNFRYKSALLHGWEYLRAIPGRVFDSNYDEYDEMKFLEKFNKDGKDTDYISFELFNDIAKFILLSVDKAESDVPLLNKLNAVNTFIHSKIDILVMGNYYCWK